MFNLADSLIELLQGATGHSFGRKVVPMVDSSWKEWEFVIISWSSYQPVRRGVIMCRWSFKWN